MIIGITWLLMEEQGEGDGGGGGCGQDEVNRFLDLFHQGFEARYVHWPHFASGIVSQCEAPFSVV